MRNDSMSDQARHTVKVLVADDNPRMREFLRRLLVASAHEVVECGDGLTAVALSREEAPAWVLMDLEMPGMDGLEATRAIRRMAPGVRVLMVTAFDIPALREAAWAAGVTGYALKSELHLLPQALAGGRLPAAWRSPYE